MINLNLLEVTYENVLKFISDYDIFKYYVDCEIGESRCSPLRKDDNPSFTIFQGKKDNILLYHDFAIGESGDCFKFVSKLFNISRFDALRQVILDFNLESKFMMNGGERSSNREPIISNHTPKVKEYKKIQVKIKSWSKDDLDYWNKFGICRRTLTKFRVYPVSNVFIGGIIFPCGKYSYAYVEGKDDNITYKIYQPYARRFKWVSNHPMGVHQGYTQLPPFGDILIITKSLKDVMALHDILQISAIGIQCETSFIKDSVMDEYKYRFKKVYVFFDNDKTGVTFSIEYTERYQISSIVLPNILTKDFSDLVARDGAKEAMLTLNKLLL